MLTPTDPTAALAALIAGNQRHIDRLAAGRAPTVSTRIPVAGTRPFALAVEVEQLRDPLADIFDVSAEQVQSFVLAVGSGDLRSGRFEVMVPSEEDLVRVVDGSVDALGFSLVVVLGRLRHHAGTIEIAFAEMERRCFHISRQLMTGSRALAVSIHGGRVRLVGAIVDERDGRVHWLGEHPEQRVILQHAAPRR
jgi:hypothetical protein